MKKIMLLSNILDCLLFGIKEWINGVWCGWNGKMDSLIEKMWKKVKKMKRKWDWKNYIINEAKKEKIINDNKDINDVNKKGFKNVYIIDNIIKIKKKYWIEK